MCVLHFIYLLIVVLLCSSLLGWRSSSVIIINGAQSGCELL